MSEVNKPIRRVDSRQIKHGHSLYGGDVYDENNNVVGPIPYKYYASEDEFKQDIAVPESKDIETWPGQSLVSPEMQTEKIEPHTEDYDPEEIDGESPKDSFLNNSKEAIYSMANKLIEKYHVKTIKGRSREILVYKSGVYMPGEELLRMDIRNQLEELATTHYAKEIIETVKDLTPADRGEFRVNVNLLNLKNGVLDITTGELAPHDPKHLFLSQIPVNFDSHVDCLEVKKYLASTLEDEQIEVVQEWFGYALYREYFIKKAIIFVGEGDTGKTTLVSLFGDFLGRENISGVSLQKISADKFSAANLYGKHINLYDDLSFHDVNDNGSFKIATGGGIITGEKKFGDQFQFNNFAKLTFACNKIPDVKDASDEAYFNRWIVISFNLVIEEEKQDKGLIHKMITADELSGLLNFALEGLKRLLKNQKFSYTKTAHQTKNDMMRSGSAITRFISECLTEATGEHVSKEDMYQAFAAFAVKTKLQVVSMKAFGSKLQLYAPYVAEFRPANKKEGGQVTAWRNVRLKDQICMPPLPEWDPQAQDKLIS